MSFFISTALFDWLTLTFCSQDGCDPADDFLLQKIVRRIAGVSPACSCTQPLVIEFFLSQPLYWIG
ncbi:MAG: hypothetical protein LBP59_05000 [Planctomycetaceae bacterium]|nr:hypothetical protein [Planctomycetaceae bacterium]